MAAKRNAEAMPENDDTMAQALQIINAEASTLKPTQRAVLDMLTTLENLATDETEGVSRSFGDDIAAILLAPDEAAMWEADELPRINAKVLSGCHLIVYGWEVRFSDSEDVKTGLIGPKTHRKMYLLIRSARMSTAQKNSMYRLPPVGEDFTWNTSARLIVAKLVWLRLHGRFDNGSGVLCQIEGTELDGGKSIEKLKEMPGATVAGVSVPETEAPF